MTTLPDIPRLYTALAEWLACVLLVTFLKKRFSRAVTVLICLGMLVVQSVFLWCTALGRVPLAWWLPCMAAAVLLMYLLLFLGSDLSGLQLGYYCAQAFVLAELAASVEWQLHCWLLPGTPPYALRAVLLMAAVYGGIYGGMALMMHRRPDFASEMKADGKTMFSAVVLALTAFSVSNLTFVTPGASTMAAFYVRTLVDLAGVLVLSVQEELLREAYLRRELTEMNRVLDRQYEQYRQSRENIRLLHRSYHDLKLQIAQLRAERDPGRQAAVLDGMEHSIREVQAQAQTGHAVLDTILTSKTLCCQQHGIHLSCQAEGRPLQFLSTVDLCSIVGTALDNAIEAVRPLPDGQRIIRAAIFVQKGFVMFRFENYCPDPVELGEDGLPQTGYGVRTMQAAAARYGGTLTVHWEEGWFTLRVLLPLPR